MEQINRAELERAQNRILEMNSRARQAGERYRAEREKAEPAPLGIKREEAARSSPGKDNFQKRNSVFDIINFKSLSGDSDRSLLVGIMLLLGADAADEKLMLALLYIMM